MNRRDFIGAAIGALCSGYEPACQDPAQLERAFMLADLVAAGLVSFSLAERLADELRLEERCFAVGVLTSQQNGHEADCVKESR